MKRLRLLPILFSLLFVLVPLWAQQADFRPDYGLLNGRRYMNGYFGFSYRFPEGWTGSALKYPAVGESKMYPLFSANPQAASTSDVRYVSINADYLAPNTVVKTPKDFLEVALNAQTGPSGEFEALHTDKRYVLGGKQFYRVDMKAKPSPGSPVFYQTLICTIQRGYAITFSFMAANNDDLEELVRTMESLSFSEPGPMPSAAATMVAQQQPAPVVSNTLASVPSKPTKPTVSQAPSTVLPASGRSSENAAEPQAVQSAAIPEPAATSTAAAPAPPATAKATPRRATATVSSSASEVPTAEIPQNEIPLNQVGSTSPATVTIVEATPTQPANTSTVSTTNSEPVSQSAPSHPAAPSTLIPVGRTPQRTYPAPQTSPASPPPTTAPSSPAPSARPQTSIPETATVSAAPATSTVAPAVLTQSAPPPSSTPPAAGLQAENEPVASPSTSQPMIQPVAQTQAVEAKPVPTMTAAATLSPPAASASGAPMRVHIPPAELEQFVTRKTTPVYPMIAKAAGVQGMVVLDVVVDSKGTLQKVTIVNGSALLARAAEDALRQWRFKPYMVDGNPVEMESQVAMNFRLGR